MTRGAHTLSDAGRPRILVVDDDEDTRQLIAFCPAPRAWILGDLTTDDVVRDLLTMGGVARREAGARIEG